MQLPEYDDSGMTLLLITQLGDPDETPMLRAWQMFDGGAELTVVTAQGELIRAPFRSLEEFSRLLMRIDECYPGLLDSRLFSVHPSGVLVPLARWTAANGLPLPVMNNVRDLCDLFHRPAFITFDERSNFGYGIVRRVFPHLADLPGSRLLYEACKLLITVD